MSTFSKDTETKYNGSSYKPSNQTSSFSPSSDLSASVQDFGSELGMQVGRAKAVATDYVATTRTYVEKHPLQSMAMAAATGIALGSLFSRGRSQRS